MVKEDGRSKARRTRVAEAAPRYDVELPAVQEPLSTISSKNQITLPVRLLKELALEPGDRLAMRLENGELILRPRPKNWPAHYMSAMKGKQGRTKEEIDEYIRSLRDEWTERDTSIEEARNANRSPAEK